MMQDCLDRIGVIMTAKHYSSKKITAGRLGYWERSIEVIVRGMMSA